LNWYERFCDSAVPAVAADYDTFMTLVVNDGMREFIAALEKEWTRQEIDISPEGPKGKRIVWMKEQADRLDPMIPSPVSILDRKKELSFHFD
jgi:hypothetical protein